MPDMQTLTQPMKRLTRAALLAVTTLALALGSVILPSAGENGQKAFAAGTCTDVTGQFEDKGQLPTSGKSSSLLAKSTVGLAGGQVLYVTIPKLGFNPGNDSASAIATRMQEPNISSGRLGRATIDLRSSKNNYVFKFTQGVQAGQYINTVLSFVPKGDIKDIKVYVADQGVAVDSCPTAPAPTKPVATPEAPTFDQAKNELMIPGIPGVVYMDNFGQRYIPGQQRTLTLSPGQSISISAVADNGYDLAPGNWSWGPYQYREPSQPGPMDPDPSNPTDKATVTWPTDPSPERCQIARKLDLGESEQIVDSAGKVLGAYQRINSTEAINDRSQLMMVATIVFKDLDEKSRSNDFWATGSAAINDNDQASPVGTAKNQLMPTLAPHHVTGEEGKKVDSLQYAFVKSVATPITLPGALQLEGGKTVKFMLDTPGIPAGLEYEVRLHTYLISASEDPADCVVKPVITYPNQSQPGPGTPGDYPSLPPLTPDPGKTYAAFSPTAPNPQFPRQCGGSMAFVIDVSNSVMRTARSGKGGLYIVADALDGVINNMRGTPTKIAIYTFATHANMIDKNLSGQPKEGTVYDLSTEEGRRGAALAVESLRAYQRWWNRQIKEPDGSTNWQGGLKSVAKKQFNVVYFLTDGVPTTTTNGINRVEHSYTNHEDLDKAIIAANELKESGTRIHPLMIGTGIDNRTTGDFEEYILKSEIKSWKYSSQGGPYYDLSEFAGKVYTVADGLKRNAIKFHDGRRWITNFYNSRQYASLWSTGTIMSYDMARAISSPNFKDDEIAITTPFGADTALPARLAEQFKEMIVKNCEGVVLVNKQIVGRNGELLSATPDDWQFNLRQTTSEPYVIKGRVASDLGIVREGVRRTDRGLAEFKLDYTDRINRGYDNKVDFDLWETQNSGNDETGKKRTDFRNVFKGCTAVDITTGEKRELADKPLTQADTPSTPAVRLKGITNNMYVSCVFQNTRDTPLVPKLDLVLKKVDANEEVTPLVGAEFKVYPAKKDPWTGLDIGDGQGHKVPDYTAGIDLVAEDGIYTLRNTLKEGTWFLVETKTPDKQQPAPVGQDADQRGYSLLPQPIEFEVYKQNDRLEAKVTSAVGGLVGVSSSYVGSAAGEVTTFAIQLANVHTGNLPHTGGAGVWWPAGIAAAMILGGLGWVRRKQQLA